MAKRFPSTMAKRYSGPIRIMPGELDVNYGKGKTIFIEHLNDLFAEGVPEKAIEKILSHCARFSFATKYVFQTKNPQAYMKWDTEWLSLDCLLGTTIETNRAELLSGNAPSPISRYAGICKTSTWADTFITVEPILDFDLDVFSEMLIAAEPDFVNIGADSKGHGLIEPSAKDINDLIAILQSAGVEIRQKRNLERLLKV